MATGLVAIGGVNAIGILAIGGVNAMGLVAVGGVNARGLFTYTWWSRDKSNLRAKPAGARVTRERHVGSDMNRRNGGRSRRNQPTAYPTLA